MIIIFWREDTRFRPSPLLGRETQDFSGSAYARDIPARSPPIRTSHSGARGKKFGGALVGEEEGEIFGSPHNVPPSRAARRKKEEGQGQGRTEWEWAVPGRGKKKEKRGGETPAKKRFLPACEEERHEEEEEEEERKLIPSLLYRPVLEEDNTHQFFFLRWT